MFRELLAADSLVYAGYSAGPCVLSPSLRGLELIDDANAVTRVHGAPPVWEGLALLGEAFVPHYGSPGHPETAAMERVVTRYRAEGVAYRTLRDGQALLERPADGDRIAERSGPAMPAHAGDAGTRDLRQNRSFTGSSRNQYLCELVGLGQQKADRQTDVRTAGWRALSGWMPGGPASPWISLGNSPPAARLQPRRLSQISQQGSARRPREGYQDFWHVDGAYRRSGSSVGFSRSWPARGRSGRRQSCQPR